MSSVGSVNSDISLERVSSNERINDTSVGRLRTTVPDVKKDTKYWERRRRNNEAARRSREKRRMNDMDLDKKILELATRNKQLENELSQIQMVNGAKRPSSIGQKTPKVAPFIPVTEVENEHITTIKFNGMSFPILQTIKNETCTSDNPKPTKTIELSSLNGSKIDTEKEVITLQSNVLSLSGIPFLANLLAPPNYNEDISLKPTLLLPPFQIPPKPAEMTEFPNTQCSDIAEIRRYENTVPKTIKSPIDNTERHDILDLRMKNVNAEKVPAISDEVKSTFGVITGLNRGDNNSRNHIGDKNHQFNETVNNSFLSGESQTLRSKDDCSGNDIQHNRCQRKNQYKALRRQKNSTDNKTTLHSLHRKTPVDHSLNLRLKLQIRDQVTRTIRHENKHLHGAITSLRMEIKELKSIILSLSRTTNSPAIN